MGPDCRPRPDHCRSHDHVDHSDLRAAGDRLTEAALQVPRPATEHLPLRRATPGWPLPLPRHPVPSEWAGRLTELSAIAWRLTQPPRNGFPHPVGTLRAIAEIGYHVHTRTANHPDTPPEQIPALQARAQVWSRIHACAAAVHTPTSRLPADQHWSLLRTRELAAVGELDAQDLLAGRSALALAATYGAAAVEHFAERPGVTVGPRTPTELRVTADVALAALHRETIPLPRDSAARLAELFQTASRPLGQGGRSAPLAGGSAPVASHRPRPPGTRNHAPLRSH